MRAQSVVAALFLLAASCGEPTGPGDAGSYDLVGIDGKPLPLIIPRDFPWADMRILPGSRLILDKNRRAAVIWVRDWLDESGVSIPDSRREVRSSLGVYSVQGTEIRFWGFDWVFFGTVSAGTITVECNVYTTGVLDLPTPCTLVFSK